LRSGCDEWILLVVLWRGSGEDEGEGWKCGVGKWGVVGEVFWAKFVLTIVPWNERERVRERFKEFF
jgi:hypothetical protein